MAEPSIETQFSNYETHTRVFEQVFSLLGSSSTITQLYVTITGGLWLVVGSDTLHLDWPYRLLVLAMHLAISISVAVAITQLASTIEQRLNFLRAMGKFWPAFQNEGNNAGRSGLRPHARIWLAAPIVGGGGSLLFGLVLAQHSLADIGAKRAPCDVLVKRLSTPTDRASVEAAKFLFDKLQCSPSTLQVPFRPR